MAAFAHLGALGLFAFAILDSSPVPTFGGADILLIILVATRPHPWYEYTGRSDSGLGDRGVYHFQTGAAGG
jgi:hypothetical protein